MEAKTENVIDSYFASANRTSESELLREIDMISDNPVIDTLLLSVGGFLAVLDENREIVSINDSLLQLLNIGKASDIFGLRPGEALKCNRVAHCPNGCGTSQYCSSCGAAIAIVSALTEDKTVEKICHVTAGSGDNSQDLAFQVRAHPFYMDDKRFILLFLQDITMAEQRVALERTFFHDINNLLQGLSTASEMLKQENVDDKLIDIVSNSSRLLINEVSIQRCLLNNDLTACPMHCHAVRVEEVLKELETVFSVNPLVQDRHLLIASDYPGMTLNTDLSLLIRVLGNMVTNGLEASQINGAVSLWTEKKEKEFIFYIHNNQYIPEEISRKIFQRNYSTKEEKGRGLGTFSMKLLGERIMGGKVDFISSPQGGTVFSLSLPLD